MIGAEREPEPTPACKPVPLAQLRAWQADPAAAANFSPLSEPPWLLVDAADGDGPDGACTEWLRALSVPVIAIGGTADWAQATDLAAPDMKAVTSVLAGISHAPLAASVLVRTLRTSQGLPVESALHLESLAYATLQGGAEFQRWLGTARGRRAATIGEAGPAVRVEREGADLKLVLNRPDSRNAMTVEMRDALCEALQLALADTGVEHIVLSARGKCFSTGGDLAEFGTAPDAATAHVVRSLALPGRLLAACAARTEVHVHGACIGSGIELPAFAGRIVSTHDAWFQLPELKYGLIPGGGGTVSIARRIGRQRLAWLALSGRRIDAVTALEWGLVDALADG